MNPEKLISQAQLTVERPFHPEWTHHYELDGVTGFEDGIEMQPETVYSLLKQNASNAIEKAGQFLDNHPIITAIGTAAAIVATEVALDRATRPKSPLPAASQV